MGCRVFLLQWPFPFLLQLVLLMPLMLSTQGSEISMVLPGCPSKCGDVVVPYPFSFLKNCSRTKSYLLRCNDTKSHPPRLYKGNVQIMHIDLTGILNVMFTGSRDCFSENGTSLNAAERVITDMRGTMLSVSAVRNKFTVIGCDSVAYILDPNETTGFTTGCASLCKNRDTLKNHTCSGIGCCQTSLPRGLQYYEARFQSFFRHIYVWRFNPCSLAFVVDAAKFSFNTSLLYEDYTKSRPRHSVVLDWAIEGGDDCKTAKQNASSYACRSNNSYCFGAPNGFGYLCNCSSGYQGNPYLVDSCKDIDECQSPKIYPCRGVCTNTPGSYNCSCAFGSHSDDPMTQKCIPDPVSQKFPWPLKLAIGLVSGFFFLMITCSWFYWGFQKRRLMILKQKFFQQNGGLFMQQEISADKQTNFRTFTESELAKATNNYDKVNILGSGGHGIVYRGILEDKRIVAVKRSMMIEVSGSKEFAKEILILSKINHKNVVKVLGCCLEVEIPILVYEFMPNKTLFHHIYDEKSELLNSFDARLRIAKEAAEALAYLHSEASPPTLHGDVKPSNILLDADFTVKLSDFGTSTLTANDKAQFTTLIHGTCGYLDPEYLQTCRLTEKSDVYSFGVVLVELLTKRQAICFSKSEDAQSAASIFISCMKQNRLSEILDPQIDKEECLDQVQKVALIAKQCLSVKGEERRTMREVLQDLEFIQNPQKRPWIETEPKYVENPVKQQSGSYESKERPDTKTNFESSSLEPGAVFEIGVGR